MKILQENFSIRIFYTLYYFLFFHFILLHTHVPYPPSFISFSPPEPSSNIICSSHQRKARDRERGERLGDRCSPCRQRLRFTMSSKIGVHHALPHLPSHRRSSSSPPSGWVRSTCSFLFLFSYLLVLIQLYFIRIGIFFVFCVWIM